MRFTHMYVHMVPPMPPPGISHHAAATQGESERITSLYFGWAGGFAHPSLTWMLSTLGRASKW